jgi:hypothetical protein
MYQCIQRSDGTSIVRRAGDFEFHNTHGHVHTKDIIYTELYKVTNAETGQMWAAGEGKKLGYMPADQALADWYKFNQAAKGTSRIAGSPCEDNTNNGLGLSAGWGDVYRWQRPGNYVDFGTNGDGLYVVRITADPIGHILESNESNNTGYTYVRVTGDQVEILEYGRGMSPWDPNKEVLTPRFEGGAPW